MPFNCHKRLARHPALKQTGRILLVPVVVIGLSWALAFSGKSQELEEQHDEVVAALAAGRVEIAVVKDAIFIGTVEDQIEPGTRPPAIVPIESRRAGVLLGAIDWSSPSAKVEWARLDKELPRMRSQQPSAGTPHLQQGEGEEATDIERIGQALLERLNEVAQNLHGKLDLAEDEPLAELLVADYVADYGPEVWRLSYRIRQQQERGDFWDTKVLRPRYAQLWPPEKGQPRTLLEVRYPAEGNTPSLLELLRHGDPQLNKIRLSNPEMAAAGDAFLHGESLKLISDGAFPFLRACLNTVTPSGAGQTIAAVGRDTGFRWILAPPPEAKKPGEIKERPSGAPTLIKPPS